MFDIDFIKNEEIIAEDYDCKILTKDQMIDALIVLTNFRLLIYTDANKETDYIKALSSRMVNFNSNYEKKLEILLSEIKSINLEDNVYVIFVNDNILKFISPKIYENNLLDTN